MATGLALPKELKGVKFDELLLIELLTLRRMSKKEQNEAY